MMDWRPLAFSKDGEMPETGVVFAGYGMQIPAGRVRGRIRQLCPFERRRPMGDGASRSAPRDLAGASPADGPLQHAAPQSDGRS